MLLRCLCGPPQQPQTAVTHLQHRRAVSRHSCQTCNLAAASMLAQQAVQVVRLPSAFVRTRLQNPPSACGQTRSSSLCTAPTQRRQEVARSWLCGLARQPTSTVPDVSISACVEEGLHHFCLPCSAGQVQQGVAFSVHCLGQPGSLAQKPARSWQAALLKMQGRAMWAPASPNAHRVISCQCWQSSCRLPLPSVQPARRSVWAPGRFCHAMVSMSASKLQPLELHHRLQIQVPLMNTARPC